MTGDVIRRGSAASGCTAFTQVVGGAGTRRHIDSFEHPFGQSCLCGFASNLMFRF